MIIGKPFKVTHNCKKGYKWVIARVCDKCGDRRDVQNTKEVVERQKRDGVILCNSCNQKQRNLPPKGAYKDKNCFKKDGKWLMERVCEDCGDKQVISCDAVFSRRRKNIPSRCCKCAQKYRQIPVGENNGHWKHGITNNGYRRVNIDGKRVLLHRYVAEQKISRKLNVNEQVHHIDLDKLHNDPDNLYIYPTRSEHGLGHASLERCGFQLLNKKIWYDADNKVYTTKRKNRTTEKIIDIPEVNVYHKTDPRTGSTYAFWWDTKNQLSRRWHVMVAEKVIGRRLRRSEKVHHIDRDTLNNNPNNLAIMSNKEHKLCHCSLQRCMACLFKDNLVVFRDGIYAT